MAALVAYLMSPTIILRDCSEPLLLREMLRRSDSAWSEFIRRYRSLIYHCIAKVSSRYSREISEVEMDEIYAEILIVLIKDGMRKLRRYNPRRGTKLGSWVGMLAINATHDYLRCASRQPWMEQLDIEPPVPPVKLAPPGHISVEEASHTPLDGMIEKERWSHLEDILTEFSDRDRLFLHLYYDQGLSPTGVAEQMAISVKTVYSKKHKIREHLRRSVRDAGRTSAIHDLAA